MGSAHSPDWRRAQEAAVGGGRESVENVHSGFSGPILTHIGTRGKSQVSALH